MLRLFLFGTPRLERDGQALSLRRGKALGLLAYLATTRQTHSREALLGLLWPEFDEADARNNLRRELSILRAALGEELLVTDRRHVGWNTGSDAWVDLTDFARQLALARAHNHRGGLCEQCARALQVATTLASGPFLAGFGLSDSPVFEEWLFFQREELQAQLGQALEALAHWHDGREELPDALTVARRWLKLDPLHEPARRALMRLYARAGQHAAAMRQYEEGARLLAAELGAEPEPETVALSEAIKARQIAPAPHASAPIAPASTPPRVDQHATPLAFELPLTDFVGRTRELGELAEQLAAPSCRLLTLVGPGGIGKTRLAGELASQNAHRYAAGAALVLLASASTPAQIPAAIAAALGVQLPATGDSWSNLAGLLADREQLLVLDNMEQLLDAAPQLAQLLRAAPGLKLVVTSREALRLREEWLYRVHGLRASGADAEDDAVQLFAVRARQAHANLDLAVERPAVRAICQLVGGMPLAIELAAAWTSSLSCAEIAAEIAASLRLLETDLRNVPERHRSVQAVFDQSWGQLDDAQQRALARLSVFAGSFTREGAAAVAGADSATLARLHERGLLGRADERRYRLHPLVRSYAAQRLGEAPADERAAWAAYGRFYGGLLRSCYRQLVGGAERAGMAALADERENLPGALPFVLEQSEDAGLREAVIALLTTYFSRGPYRDGVAQLRQIETWARARQERASARLVLAETLNALGLFAVREGHVEDAGRQFTESAAIYAALAASPLPGDATDPEIGLGLVALIQGEYRLASRYAGRVRARGEAQKLPGNQAHAWYQIAEAADAQGLLPAAHAAAARALSLAREAGSEWFSAYIRNQLGRIARARGHFDEAEAQFRASYAIREAFGDREGMAAALLGLGDLLVRRAEWATAEQQFTAAMLLLRQMGDRGGVAQAQIGLGAVEAARGAIGPAWAHFQAALATARTLTFHHVSLHIVTHLAELLLAAGRADEAPALLTLALLHPASRSGTTERAQHLLARCQTLLAADSFARGVAEGRRAQLDTVVEQLLGSVF